VAKRCKYESDFFRGLHSNIKQKQSCAYSKYKKLNTINVPGFVVGSPALKEEMRLRSVTLDQEIRQRMKDNHDDYIRKVTERVALTQHKNGRKLIKQTLQAENENGLVSTMA